MEKLNKFSAKTQQNHQKTQGTGGFGPLRPLGNRPKKSLLYYLKKVYENKKEAWGSVTIYMVGT